MSETQQLPPATMTQAQHDEYMRKLDPAKIIEANKDKQEDAQITKMVNERAEREPLPATTNELFDDDHFTISTSIGMVKIRKIRAMDYTIWKMTGSPFYKMIMGDIDTTNGDKVVQTLAMDEEALYELVYQFTHDIREVYKLVKTDLKKYHELAIDEIGFIYTVKDLMDVADGIAKYSNIANQGRVEMVAPSSDDPQKKTQL